MSLVQDFIPTRKPFTSPALPVPERLSRNFRRVVWADPPVAQFPVPSDWRIIPFEYQGVPIRVYYVEAYNPRAVEWSALGLNSSIEENVFAVEAARQRGISSFILQIPPLSEAKNIEFYNGLMEAFFLHKTPYYRSYEDLTRIFRGHSTSAHGIARALMKPSTASEMVDRSDFILQVSPFIAPEYIKRAWKRALERINTEWYGDRFYGDAPFDKLVHYLLYRFKGYPNFPEDRNQRMTHAEIDYMTHACATILDGLNPDSFPQCVRDHPVTIMLGENDIVADPEFGELVARFLNASVVTIPKGRHNAPLEMTAGEEAIRTLQEDAIGRTYPRPIRSHLRPQSPARHALSPPASDAGAEAPVPAVA